MAVTRLYDLLGVTTDAAAAALWPRSRIKGVTGFSIDADPTDLVLYLQDSLEFRAVRPGAAPDGVGLSAEIVVRNSAAIRPLVFTQMPDIAFYLLNTAGTPGQPDYRPGRLYAKFVEGDDAPDPGLECVVEGLPFEIRVPSTLLGPLRTEAEESANPGGGPDVTLTDPFEPGVFDSLQVTLRDGEFSSIFVHLRIRMTAEMDFILEPATVLSIGPCRFMGLPCKGLHDLGFVPSPVLQDPHREGEQALEWTRHPLDRLSPDATYAGVITVRTFDLDSSRAPLKELGDRMNSGRGSDQVEFALEDVALPFFSMLNLPVPSHGLFGLRRKIEMGDDPVEAFAFEGAPLQIWVFWPGFQLLIDQFLLRTPASLVPLDPFAFVQMAIVFHKDRSTTLDTDITDTATSIRVDDASVFGDDTEFDITLIDPDGTHVETAAVTAVAGNTLTITRDPDKATSHRSGSSVRRRANALTVGFSDEWTAQLGWRHSKGLTLFTIAGATVSLWGARTGLSLKRLCSKSPRYEWHEQLQLLGDFGLKTKGMVRPFNLAFEIRSLSGQDIEVVLRDLGWNLGEVSLEGLTFPEGVQLIACKVVRLIIEEVGWVTENNGGRYFVSSGGVSVFGLGGVADAGRSPSTGGGSAAVSEESGSGGGFRFRRLRIRIGGDESAPKWLLDGITLSLKISQFELTGFGMISEFTDAGHTFKEFGFGLRVKFDAFAKRFEIGMQFFHGSVAGPVDNFTYWLFGFQYSPIPAGSIEFVNLRMLLAGNMAPVLPPAEGYAQNMRLFRWYKQAGNGAVTLPPGRQPTSWMRKRDSLALGIGLGVTLPVGDTIILDAFVFYAKSPEEEGLLIAIEVYILKSPKPVGFGAFELDFRHDKWGLMLGVALGLENVLGSSLPGFLSRLISLTGTLYAGNKPGTFAIGQLNDESTWLSFSFETPSFIDCSLLVALCIQIVDASDGPRGFGVVASAKGGANFGIGKIQVYANFGLIAGVWRNESKACGFVVWLEAGLRIELFFILNIGVSARVEFDYLDSSPAYRRLGCEIRIETPWWLPDVTFRFEKIWDEPHPEHIEAVSAPLLDAGALSPGAQSQISIAVTPVTGGAISLREVYSMDQVRGFGPPVLPPGTLDALTPIAVDSVIAVNFKPPVDDRLSVGETTPAGFGTQHNEDLDVTYELVEVGIRRRPRFGVGASVWTTLLAPADTRFETPADFPPDADLSAHFDSVVQFRWDRDLQREDRFDPRRLLINSSTPFTFATGGPEADENTIRNEPGWPCCSEQTSGPQCHTLDFSATPFGVRAPSFQTFSASAATLHWFGVRPIVADSTVAPPGLHAARMNFATRTSGAFAVLSFTETAYRVEIYAYWLPGSVQSAIVAEAYNGLRQVARTVLALSMGNPQQPIRFQTWDGITSVVLRYAPNIEPPAPQGGGTVEFVRMRYCGVKQQIDWIAGQEKCAARDRRTLTGGTLAWLPNHDYEVTVAVKITLHHVRTSAQEARVAQQVFFRTKGLPGLNAVERLGQELEPYVESHYPGVPPRRLYRAEPVALAFNEAFNMLVPVDRAPSPDNPSELTQILEWALVVEKVGRFAGGERVSQTSADWVVANRTVPLPVPDQHPVVVNGGILHTIVREAATLQPLQLRLETMIHAPDGCNRPGPSLHHSEVLFHDPVDPGAAPGEQQRWEPTTFYRVNVRRKDGPMVDRNPFDRNDYTAFDAAREGGAALGWEVANGAMQVAGPAADGVRRYAVFGESNWDHVQIHATVDPQGGQAGIAAGVAGLPEVSRAAIVVIDETDSTLRILQRIGGAVNEVKSEPLPANASAPYALEVLLFDDRLRARVGDTTVETARGVLREGRLALVTRDGGAFQSLRVQPLDAHRFQFQSSRFISFDDHIESFNGSVSEIPSDAAGPGASTETAASLFTATAAEIANVMRQGADRELRQNLFNRWTRGLALPLRSRLTRLEISRLIGGRDSDLLLLESPEPLPFSEDVTLAVKRRVVLPSALEGCVPGLIRAIFGSTGASSRSQNAAAALEQQNARRLIMKLDFAGDRVLGPIAPGESIQKLAKARRIVRSVKVAEGIEYRIYEVSMRPARGNAMVLSGQIAETVRPGGRVVAGENLRGVLANIGGDRIAVLDVADRPILPIVPIDPVTYVDQPVLMLTNGDETRALVIPTRANMHNPFTGGTYRLEFGIDRARYRSQAPDTTSNYRASSMLVVSW